MRLGWMVYASLDDDDNPFSLTLDLVWGSYAFTLRHCVVVVMAYCFIIHRVV